VRGDASRFSVPGILAFCGTGPPSSRPPLRVRSPYLRQAIPQKLQSKGVESPFGAFHQVDEELLPQAAQMGARLFVSGFKIESSSSFVTKGWRESDGFRGRTPFASRARMTLFSASKHLLI
jgi:hypothetical protein